MALTISGLPPATATTLGGIKVSTGLSVGADGTLTVSGIPASAISSVNPSSLTGSGTVPAAGLPVATSSALGAIKVGSGLDITSGVLSVTGGSGGVGTVTSVDMSVPSILALAGNPITSSGTLAVTLATQAANAILSGPTTGSAATPTFRALVAADIPSLDTAKITSGTLALARLSGITTSQLDAAAGITSAQIAALDAAKITSGTLPLARLSGITTTQLAASAGILGSQLDAAAAITSAQIAALDAAKITSGTLPLARLSAITTSQLSATAGIVGTQLDSAAAIASGQITSLAASKITGSGTLPDGVLSSNVPLLNAANTFTALQTATAFAPTGLTGSTAATRYVGGTTSGAPASGAHNKGDWAIGQDGSLWICTTAGTPGTWTQVSGGGGGSLSVTTKGDLQTYSTAAARQAVGADGTFLSADSSQATGLAYKFPAGVAGVSTLSTKLSADVSVTSANTFYDGPSLSLTAGTWLIEGVVTCKASLAGTDVSAKLWDGTTVYASAGGSRLTGGASGSGTFPLCAIVSPTSTTTYKISVAADDASSITILAAVATNSSGNNATSLTAVQLTGAPASGPGALMPAVRCYNSANISVATSGTPQALTFDTNRFDQGTSTAQHSTSSNTSRLTCQQAGIYEIWGLVSFAANATGIREASLRLNGTTTIADSVVSSTNTSNQTVPVSCTYQLAVGDYVELLANQTSGGALNATAVGNYSPEFGMARIDSGPGAVQPNTKVQLDWSSTTDLASGTSLAAVTWTDVSGTSQTFTVDDPNSVVEIAVSGAIHLGLSSSNNFASRLVVDPSGPNITKFLGGGYGDAGNFLAGCSTVSISGLAVGSHTVKLQVYGDSSGNFYLRSSTQPNSEVVAIRVLERKQSSGPALIPNTKVQLDYTTPTTSDIAVSTSISAATWTDIIGNQTFTVDDANSVVEVSVSGNIIARSNSGSAADTAMRIVIDSAGTPTNKTISGAYLDSSVYSNPLAGSTPASITGLAAGSHTVKLQMYSEIASNYTLRPNTHPITEFVNIHVLERKQAPTPTLNTTARYHQASGTAQSISNNTVSIINFDTLDLDTQSLVTTGASWKCTAKTAGNYQVSAAAVLASAIWTGVGKVQLFLYKNGSLYSLLGENTVQVAQTDEFGVDGTDIVPLIVGDYIDLRLYQNQGGSVALIGDGTRNYMCANRIG